MPSLSPLSAEGITKRFPGVVALRDVSFELAEGEIHALCGENGAGKSTLIKLLSGIHPYGSYEGRLRVRGRPAEFRSVADAEREGIAVIYQELALVPEMTAAENLFLGSEPARLGLIDFDAMHREARRLLERFGLRLDPQARTGDLGVGQQQLLEILKALRKDSRVLILDEPTAALSEREVSALLGILRELRGRGISCVYISHKLDEVFGIADRVTVLRDGATIGTWSAAAMTKGEAVRHMVGREIRDFFPRRAPSPGAARLSVRDLTVSGAQGKALVRGVSFEARAGEVLGLGGLMGAGRSELLLHLAGVWGRRERGAVTLDGRPLAPGRPWEALRSGLALVTEDRRRWGLFASLGVGFNLSLSSIARLAARGLIDEDRELKANRSMADALRVKAAGLETPVGGLSGGNQQKVVIGRALMTEPAVVLLDEPTRGIDVGAKLEVYEIV
ncbi:MAG: sugar ABC transporter ATP-binding protein, partial [Elusimicrobia bacterium]|nr:sugar ABC transporter ATP-binding protein [Elusimicrobiota bacterium]